MAEEPAAKMAKTEQPMLTLSSGHKMPMIGLGTWKSKPGEVKAAVEAAIDAGYRHIDCAAIYGNEVEVGEAFKAKFGSTVPREEVFVTSKLWNTAHKKENVKAACEKTLKDLGLTYLDLYLVHWPHAFQAGDVMLPKKEDGSIAYDEETEPSETWAAMEELVAAGLVKSIGISNFNARQVKDIMGMCKIKPAMNQVERHPYFDQNRLMKVCSEFGIPLTAYCPLGSGDNPSRKPDDPVLLEDKVLAEIGAQYGKSAAQVAIRWQVDSGVVVVPKSVNPARIAQNLDVLDFKLSKEDMDAIAAINRDWRCNVPSIVVDGVMKARDAGHKHYPFNDPF
eukprot:gb/GFBE01081118.1/.p1 GENE.gb/GFBE01081118.1/~~gb/GFBE01081118.1/.p1  ORF type:complete len:336 (+),score=116.77 gb/GFBE01081118.1/:1-1008(+)